MSENSTNKMTSARRPFLKGSGLAIMGSLFASASNAQTNDISQALSLEEQANIQLVEKFCANWASMDLQNVVAEMTEDAIYRMTQDVPSVSGHQGLIDQMQPWVDSSSAIEFKILETYARGPLVINHRIDTFTSETRPIVWEGVGVFLLEDGKIREWSDYTIEVAR